MDQSDFSYPSSHGEGASQAAVTIFCDDQALASDIADDCSSAGLTILGLRSLSELNDVGADISGEIIVADVPNADAGSLAALATLDMAVMRGGNQLIVSTNVDALDAVFGCLDQSHPQILVDPNRAERVIALGRALTKLPRGRVRELTEEDRLSLLRLTEQVGQIAERLDRMNTYSGRIGAFRFESPTNEFNGADEAGTDRLIRTSRPPLPDPRLVRRIIRQRQLRARFLDGELFADPAWDMLLDLTAARAEHMRVSVTSLCIASGVPPTTALRWISQMTETGLLIRVEDDTDRRRAFIALTDRAADAMSRYFAELGVTAAQLV